MTMQLPIVADMQGESALLAVFCAINSTTPAPHPIYSMGMSVCPVPGIQTGTELATITRR